MRSPFSALASGFFLAMPSLPLLCQALPPALWKPDPANSRLEILTPLGGWASLDRIEVRVRLADPTDPLRSVDEYRDRGDYWEERRQEEEKAFKDRVMNLLGGDEEVLWEEERLSTPEGWSPEEAVPQLSKPLERLKAEHAVREELNVAERARRRELKVWFNGELTLLDVEVNRIYDWPLVPREGENRFEILDPVTKRREVRTWWSTLGIPRLKVVVHREGDSGRREELTVLEPGGALRRNYGLYTNAYPAVGTYTLRCETESWSSWWSPQSSPPRLVCADITLDGGSDRERQWHFEQLVIPGAGATILGSFDVED